ncbi:MAG: hypothetical protein WA125_17085 [Desulfosporosinus sp.]
MELYEGLTVELTAITGLTNKVFPATAPQGTKEPYLVYFLGGNERAKTLIAHDGLVESQYQLDVYHSTYALLYALKKLVIAEIKTWSQSSIGATGPYIQQVEIMTDFETYDNVLRLHKGIVEFNVHYTES